MDDTRIPPLTLDDATVVAADVPSPPVYSLPRYWQTAAAAATAFVPLDSHDAMSCAPDTLQAPCGVIYSRTVLCTQIMPTLLRMTHDGAFFVVQTSMEGPMLLHAATLQPVRRLHHVGSFWYKLFARDRLIVGGPELHMPQTFFPLHGDKLLAATAASCHDVLDLVEFQVPTRTVTRRLRVPRGPADALMDVDADGTLVMCYPSTFSLFVQPAGGCPERTTFRTISLVLPARGARAVRVFATNTRVCTVFASALSGVWVTIHTHVGEDCGMPIVLQTEDATTTSVLTPSQTVLGCVVSRRDGCLYIATACASYEPGCILHCVRIADASVRWWWPFPWKFQALACGPAPGIIYALTPKRKIKTLLVACGT